MKQLWKAGLLLVFAGTFSGALWSPGTEVVYDYEADLATVTKYPVESESQWSMKGKLVVQGDQDSATVQLQDVKISTYTGPAKHNTSLSETTPPEEASQLQQPFILHFEEGKLVALSVKAGEDEWAINMKRGLAGLLQLDPEALHSPIFVSTENGLHGHCKVEYSSRNFTNNTVSVTKSVDFATCPGSTTQGFSSFREALCPAGHPKTLVDILSIRTYTLEPSGPSGEYVISNAAADGGIYFQPFKSQSEAYYIWTWMELKLAAIGATENPLNVKGGGEKVSLKFVLPTGDVSQGRSIPTQPELLSVIIKMLHELGESLDPPGLEKNLSDLHEEKVAHVVYLLSLLNHTSLDQLYSDLAVGTSYQHETFRNLFLQMLPLVGSEDGVLLIRDLVMGGTLKNDTAVELLTVLPFSLRHASEQLLKDLEVLLTLPEDSVLYSPAILSFASLVYSICHTSCGHEVQDKYVGKYLDLFTSSDTIDKQILYLQALGNFRLKKVAQYFEPIIQGTDTKYSHYIRFLALWLTENNGYLNSEKAFQLYWPILSNHDELLEMRMGALMLLTRSNPSTARFYHIMTYMVEEQDPHLRHYWYTTLHSLVHTNHPYFSHLLEAAKKAIRFYPEPDVHQWFSGHYIFDYINPKYGFGSVGQLSTIPNPHTGAPQIIMLHLGSTARICSYIDYVLFLRIEGFGDLAKHLISKNKLNVDKLLELLKELKVPTVEAKPIHMELILQTQGKTVMVHYANETTISSMIQVLNNVKVIASGGVHVNIQNIVVPFLLEELGSTDVGTTALLRITHSWLTSMRANLTAGDSVLSQLDFRSYLSSQTALAQYNPILNMWHGVQRSLNVQIIIPFDLQFSFQSVKDHIKLAIHHKPGEEAGVVGHVETIVLVRGITAGDNLKSHCPKCPKHQVIKANTENPSSQELAEVEFLGSELKVLLLDCEHSYRKEDVLSALHYVAEHQNSHMIPSLAPLLSLTHLYDFAILVPPSGSCGFLIKLSPLTEEPTQVEVEITVNNTHKSQTSGDYTVQMVVTSNSSSPKTWEIDMHYAPSKHRLSTNLSSEDGHIGSMNIQAQFPEPVDEVSFLLVKEPHSAVVEISTEWDDSSLQIRMDGEVTTEQQEVATDSSLWLYSTCQKDLHDTEQWGEVFAPITPACHQVAKELATLRRYNFSITSTNLPSWLNFLPQDNMTVHVEVPLDSRATITVNGHKKVLGTSKSNKLQPLLINTHFPLLLQLGTHLGNIGSCVVTSKSAWTMDGVNLDTHLGTCYSLAVADCSETPHFALFVKKSDSKWLPLALKLYTGDSTVELVPHERKISITVNGLEVPNPEQGYQYPPGESNYHFRVWKRSDGLVRIFLTHSRMWIDYYGHFATATVSGIYRGKLCGLCGNYNRITKDDTVHLYTIPCEA